MPASPEEIAEAEEEGTKITCGYGPKEFLSENGRVTAVVLKKVHRPLQRGRAVLRPPMMKMTPSPCRATTLF